MLLLALVALALGAGAQSEPRPPCRVIWVAVDSLRADHVHFGGYERETTPWLDEFAGSCAEFRAAYSPANSTEFSVAATMTGVYYSLLNHNSYPPRIPHGVDTLPQLFQRAGFRTYGWIGNVLLVNHKREGFAFGFDDWHGILPRRAPTPTIDEIIACVHERYEPTGGPEFHYVHTMDVHEPYVPPMPFDRLWPGHMHAGAVRYGSMREAGGELVLSNLPYHSEGHTVSESDIAFLVTQYDGAIRYTDARLPLLLDALGYDADTDLIIISSDHGEQFFEHGFWGHGKTLYPEEIHVPLLVGGPGIVQGRHETPLSLVDLFPTLCALFGLPIPAGICGANLLPCLRGEGPVTSHRVYAEAPYWTGGVGAPEAVVIERGHLYKLAARVQFRHPWKLWPFSEEMFELDVDPGCRRNMVADRTGRADELNRVLREINPRYAPYTPEVIRGEDSDIVLGENIVPDLATEENGAVRVRDTMFRRAADKSLMLVAPEADVAASLDTAPGQTYVLAMEWQLASGVARVILADESTGEPFYTYTFRKPRQEWRALRAVVVPPRRLSVLTLRMVSPGRIRIRNLSMRSAHMPTPCLVPWKRHAHPIEEAVRPLDPDVAQALDALGYVGTK